MRRAVTETQRTINGGTAIRENVYVDMKSSRINRGIKADW